MVNVTFKGFFNVSMLRTNSLYMYVISIKYKCWDSFHNVTCLQQRNIAGFHMRYSTLQSWCVCVFSPQYFNLSVFSPRRRDHLCLYCCHFTVNDLGFGLPSVCRKVTRPLCASLPFFLCLSKLLFLCFYMWPFFLSHILSFLLFSLSLCVCVSVAPVLTPPESEKADSEDRVSLKVCSQHSSLLSAYFSWWKCTLSARLQTLHPFHLYSFRLPHEEDTDNNLHLCVFLLSFCQTPKRVEVHSIHTYVALYKFLPQEKNDLELQSVKLLRILYCVCIWE